MKTVCVQIGNSDNKLTQKEWCDFVNATHKAIRLACEQIHFSAPSVGWADWQNAAWVFEVSDEFTASLKEILLGIRKYYKQNSIAWLEGETEFI